MVDFTESFKLLERLRQTRIDLYDSWGVASQPLLKPYESLGDMGFQLIVNPLGQLLISAVMVPLAFVDMLGNLVGLNHNDEESDWYQSLRCFLGIFYFVVHAVVDPLWELLSFVTRLGASLVTISPSNEEIFQDDDAAATAHDNRNFRYV